MIHRAVLAFVTLGLGTPAFSADDAKPRKKRLPEVLVVGDAAVKDDALRPTPQKPVHYLVIGGVATDLGEEVFEVRRPNEATVRGELVKALASQGFLEARPGGPLPQIAVLFSWGSASYYKNDEILEQSGVNEKNRHEIGRLLGHDKIRRLISQFEADQINDAYHNDRFYLVVAAMDLAAAKRKERRVLWRSRMSLDWRDDGPETLGVMLASAAPFFGRETERGVFIDDEKRRKAEVTIGDVRVVEETKTPPNAPAGK